MNISYTRACLKMLYYNDPKFLDGHASINSGDPDQTAHLEAPLGAVFAESALFAKAYLSKNLG